MLHWTQEKLITKCKTYPCSNSDLVGCLAQQTALPKYQISKTLLTIGLHNRVPDSFLCSMLAESRIAV